MPDTGGQMMLMRQMQKEQMEMQKMYQKRREELRIEEENRMKRERREQERIQKEEEDRLRRIKEQEEMAIAEAESSINEQDNNPLMIDFYNALAEGQSNVSNEDQYYVRNKLWKKKTIAERWQALDAQRTTKLERARRCLL